MSAEYTYYVSEVVASEVQELIVSFSMTLTIANTGDLTGSDLGFYLQVASSNGPFEYPSTDSPAINLVDILAQGASGYGLTIDQDGTITRFTDEAGSSYGTRIPLTAGSGTDGDQLAPGATVEVILSLTFEAGTPSKNFYVDLVIA
jgi:hypothetical protein